MSRMTVKYRQALAWAAARAVLPRHVHLDVTRVERVDAVVQLELVRFLAMIVDKREIDVAVDLVAVWDEQEAAKQKMYSTSTVRRLTAQTTQAVFVAKDRLPDEALVEGLPMGTRLANTLSIAHLETVGALRERWSFPDRVAFFMQLPNFGKKTLQELEALMAQIGENPMTPMPVEPPKPTAYQRARAARLVMIRNLRADGLSLSAIAKRVNVGRERVRMILVEDAAARAAAPS